MHKTSRAVPRSSPCHSLLASAFLAIATLAGSSLQAQTAIEVHHGYLPAIPWTAPTGPLPSDVPCTPPKHDRLPSVPIGDGSIVTTPGRAATPGGGPMQPSAFTVYRNTIVKPAGANTSNVGEPTTTHLGGSAIMVGNWYTAVSGNDGTTWSYVNPYTKFPASDGGFCCDQYTIASPANNLVVWALQYIYSATTQKNTIRLACILGAGNLATGTVAHYYDFAPTGVGYAAGTWFDYTHLARSNTNLFLAGNVFAGAGPYLGSFVMRVPLAQMASGGTISYSYFYPAQGSPRCSSGIDDTMYIATHVSTTSLRIHTWPDGGGPSNVDRTIGTWDSGVAAQNGPDGNNFLSRADNRITTGYHNSREVGFYWTSNLGGSFTRPFVRGVRFDRDNSLAVIGDENIWSSLVAWAYPAAGTNIAGHVALLCAYGGGTFHAGCDVFLRDDVNCLMSENQSMVGGDAGPSGGFGDYYSVQRHWAFPMTFVAAGCAQRGGTGGANSEPHDMHFGRTSTTPTLFDLSVASQVPSGAAIAVGLKDNYCEQSGNTPFVRTYKSGANVLLTAASTLGSKAFYRWKLDGVDQTLGLTSLAVPMTAAHAAVAVYGVYTTPLATNFGTGCPGSGGVPSLAAAAAPLIGFNLQHKLTNGPVGKSAYLVLGGSKTSWPPLTLPFTLPSTSCTFYCDQAVALGQIVPVGGVVTWNIGVPNTVTLLGGKLYFQDVNLDPGANIWSVTTSNAVEETVGGWNLN